MVDNAFERDAIMNIQRYLRHLSFGDDEIVELPLDGIWDSATRDALIGFQKKMGLLPTGTVDRETFDILKREYDRSVALNSPPARIDLFPREPKGYSLRDGDTGILVDTVQYILSELERLYSLPEIKRSGVYDPETAQAISYFQERNSIPSTGRVDRETWDALAVQHNLLDKYNE
ncbi:MAG: hypothetical protein E7611_07565 [Ruminococcaceae bacterium]|nr:hypothetical protein [Oscillospiraceae bacterium]